MSSVQNGNAVFMGLDENVAVVDVVRRLTMLQAIDISTPLNDFAKVTVTFAMTRPEMLALSGAIADAPDRKKD